MTELAVPGGTYAEQARQAREEFDANRREQIRMKGMTNNAKQIAQHPGDVGERLIGTANDGPARLVVSRVEFGVDPAEGGFMPPTYDIALLPVEQRRAVTVDERGFPEDPSYVPGVYRLGWEEDHGYQLRRLGLGTEADGFPADTAPSTPYQIGGIEAALRSASGPMAMQIERAEMPSDEGQVSVAAHAGRTAVHSAEPQRVIIGSLLDRE